MTEDQVVGMVVGLFVGDALGAPYEFIPACDIPSKVVMTSGGIHNVSLGEYTDDGAMAMAIADAYVTHKNFEPSTIANNFIKWKNTGLFGTRDYVFDIGITTSSAINRMTPFQPYASKCDNMSSGNGSLMRLAPIIAANHENMSMAIAESIAVSLMTHGSRDIVQYTTAFVEELMCGKRHKYDSLRNVDVDNATGGRGTIMYAYNAAWHCCHYGAGDFEDAVTCAVKLGHDTDTNAAITGMLMGARCGLRSIPSKWLNKLRNKEHIINVAKTLYQIGVNRTVSVQA